MSFYFKIFIDFYVLFLKYCNCDQGFSKLQSKILVIGSQILNWLFVLPYKINKLSTF